MKHLLAIMILLMACSSCSASSTKQAASEEAAPAQPETIILPDTALMISDSIPEGSVKVAVSTSAGDFTILLYGDTPGHRDNFLKLVADSAYNGTLFHRVIKDFMVQGGDLNSKDAPAGTLLGGGSEAAPIPAEIVFPRHFHKRGALAAARQGDYVNPERRSSASQFYVVTGKTFSPAELDQMDRRLRQSVGQNHFNELAKAHESEIRSMQAAGDRDGLNALQQKLSEETNAWLDANPVGMTQEMRNTYTRIGGAPHLDNEYTVFGELISGMETINKIQNAKTDANDRPEEDIKIISMKVVE